MSIADGGGSSHWQDSEDVMSSSTDYTNEEWKVITVAPFLAGLFVSVSDPSGIGGVMKESMAVGKAIAEAGAGSEVGVIKSLAEGLKAAGFSGRPQLPDIPRTDANAARTAMAEHLQKAVAVVASKSPAEADAFKTWLFAAAQRVAEAAKEGGFLGFGGTQVSEQEHAALAELAGKLGVPAPARPQAT
jgi:hypothetical protein